MKVLFVCQRNNARSQMAKAIYNTVTHSQDADSAGLMVNTPGQLLKERATEEGSGVSKVIDVMDEIGVDVSSYSRTPFVTSFLKDYDKIIVMAELDNIPDWLRQSPKFEYWEIEDPRGKDHDGVREAREEIKQKVLKLIN